MPMYMRPYFISLPSAHITGKSEVMQTVGSAVFARIPSGRDKSKTPALATPRDGGEALVIFSNKNVHAGPECAVPLLGLREETVRNEIALNRRGEARLSDERT